MRLTAWLAIAIAVLGTGTALGATPAGQAVGVDPSARDGSRTLVVGSDVAMGDRIATGPTGQVQLIFNDDTHLVVGPSSQLVVESYLLRSDKSAGQFAVNALSGTFRFITGKSDHSAYTIDTPTGTIGVRGTGFDFVVDSRKPVLKGYDPGLLVALFFGSVEVCNLSGKCVVLTRTCDIALATGADAVALSHLDAAEAGARARFRYISTERPLLQPFRIPQSRLCYINAGDNNTTLATPVPNEGTPRPRGGLSTTPPTRGGGSTTP